MPTLTTNLKQMAALLLVTCAAATAHAQPLADNFNDNLINPSIWKKRIYGGMNAIEKNGRLEMLANGYTGNLSFAGLVGKGWGIDWRQSFSMSINYKLQIAPPVGLRSASAGLAISFQDGFNPSFSGISMGIERDKYGFWLVCCIWDRGQIVHELYSKVYSHSGTLVVVWNRATDRLTVTSQNKVLTVIGLWKAYGASNGNKPLVVSMGALTEKGNMLFGGHLTNLDNFSFKGVRRPRP